MEFNLSTFILEIINFLILVWILKRFFYQPVLDVIDKRKQRVDSTLTAVKEQQAKAEELQTQYENRLTHWEQEKKRALEAFHQEIETERFRLMEELKVKLEEERSKAKVIDDHLFLQKQRSNEERALKQGAHFAGLLLKQAANSELEKSLFALLLNELSNLPEKHLKALRFLHRAQPVSVTISSAYKLEDQQRKKIQHRLNALINHATDFHYRQDPELIAGFKIAIESWVLHANLQHELVGFAEIADVSERS